MPVAWEEFEPVEVAKPENVNWDEFEVAKPSNPAAEALRKQQFQAAQEGEAAGFLGALADIIGGSIEPILQGPAGIMGQVERGLAGAGELLGITKPGTQFPEAYKLSTTLRTPISKTLLGSEIPQIPPQTGLAKYPAGVANAVVDLANFFQTPEAISFLGIGALPEAAKKSVAAGFAGTMFAQAPEQAQAALESFKQGDVQEGIRHVVGSGLTATMAGLAGRGGMEPVKLPTISETRVAPTPEVETGLRETVRPEALTEIDKEIARAKQISPPAPGSKPIELPAETPVKETPEVAGGETFDTLSGLRTAVESNEPTPVDAYIARNGAVSQGPGLVGIKAYHGTPHEIRGGFTTEKVGTGEGAQAYGWGLYFAENPEVIKTYRMPQGSEAHRNLISEGDAIQSEAESLGLKVIHDFNEGGEKIIGGNVPDSLQKRLDKYNDAFKGNEYSVSINAKPEELLDWDKPFSEQSEKIKSLIKSQHDRIEKSMKIMSGKFEGIDPKDIPQSIVDARSTLRYKAGRTLWNAVKTDNSGEGIYRGLSRDLSEFHPSENTFGTPEYKAASEFLSSIGIKGIRYLDQGSRSAKNVKPTYNYVIFDGNDVHIISENGKSLPITDTEATKGLLEIIKPEGETPVDIAKKLKPTQPKAEYAAEKIIEQKSVQPERERTDALRPTAEAGPSDSLRAATEGKAQKEAPEVLLTDVPSRAKIDFETYDEPTGQWQKQSRNIVVSKSTIPGDKPWRATVFAGPPEDPVAIAHIQLDKPSDLSGKKAIDDLAEQLGRYTRKIEISGQERKAGVATSETKPLAPVSAAPEPGAPKPQPPSQPAEGVGGVPSKMLSSGEVTTTSSGRKTTPFPKVTVKSNLAVKRVEEWLRQNAIDEAKSRGDEFNQLQFQDANPKKLTQAEKDSMNEYLFGQQPEVQKPILKEVKPTTPPTAGGEGKPAKTLMERYEAGEKLTPKEQRELRKSIAAAETETPEVQSGEGMRPGPGAATAGTTGTGSAIRELGDYVAALPPLKGKQKLTMAQKWAEAKAAGKDLGTRIALKSAAITESIKDSMRGVRKPTELGDSIGQLDYLLQKSAGESLNTRKQLEHAIRDPATRDALWIYADAKGDLNAIRDTLATMPRDTKPAVRRALERALNLPQEAKDWLPFVEQFYGRKFAEAEAEGVLHEALPDYFTHVWKIKENMPGAVQAALNSGKISEYFRYARERKLATMLEGIKNPNMIPGMKLEPVLDAAKIVSHYNYALDRAIASRKFMERLSEMNASDGRPLVAPSGKAIPSEELKWAVINDSTGKADPGVKGIFDTDAEAQAELARRGPGYHVEQRKNEFLMIKSRLRPEEIGDYRSIDHPSMRKWQWAGTDDAGKTTLYEGELLAHPEAYERLARFMDRSRLTPSKAVSAALRYSGEIKAAKLGLLSTFHQLHVMKHALFHATNPFNAKPIDWEAPDVRYAIEKGHLKLAPEPGELNQFAEGILADQALIHKLPILGEWSRQYSHYLFTDYIPRLKMATFHNALARNMELYGARRSALGKAVAFGAKPLSEAEIAARVGDSVNAAFGELNKLWLGKQGRDPRFQRALRLMFLAPDFGEARLRFVGKAFTKYGAEERFALAMNFATVYGLARLANWLASGDPHGDDPKHWFDVKVGDHWYSMRSVMTDIAHGFAKPESFTRVRLNPGFVEPVLEFLTSRDWRGQRRTGTQQLLDFGKRLVPLPLQAMTEDDRHMWEGFFGSMGVQPKRGDAVSEIHERAKKYKEARGIQESVEVSASTAGNPYREARLGLEFNDQRRFWRAIQDQYNRLKLTNNGDPVGTIRKAFERYYSLPFTGKKRLEEDFKASLAPKDKKIYMEAEKERQQSKAKFDEWWKWHNYVLTGQK